MVALAPTGRSLRWGRLGVRWIGGGRPRGVGRVLVQPGFEVGESGLGATGVCKDGDSAPKTSGGKDGDDMPPVGRREKAPTGYPVNGYGSPAAAGPFTASRCLV